MTNSADPDRFRLLQKLTDLDLHYLQRQSISRLSRTRVNPFIPAEKKTSNFANSVDPDEMAHYEPSHLDLHCLPFCSCFWPDDLFAMMDMPKIQRRKIPLYKYR